MSYFNMCIYSVMMLRHKYAIAILGLNVVTKCVKPAKLVLFADLLFISLPFDFGVKSLIPVVSLLYSRLCQI